jgi:hypothetical protein
MENQKMNYNHPVWPSPRARLVAIKLGLDCLPYGERIKRLTHAQALELLRRRSGKKTIEEFLSMTRSESLISIGSYSRNHYNADKYPIDPLRSCKY